MKIVLRLDLDYVPWDASSHDEPAAFVRLLELGRQRGLKYHFFASTRSVLTFPSMSDQALNDGHDVDWLAPRQHEPLDQAMEAFRTIGHTLQGGSGPDRVDGGQLDWWVNSPAQFDPLIDADNCANAISAREPTVILRARPSDFAGIETLVERWHEVVQNALQAGYELGTLRQTQ